jgi:hypothetical protein
VRRTTPIGAPARSTRQFTACHLVTCFVAGLLAYTVLDYEALFQTTNRIS